VFEDSLFATNARPAPRRGLTTAISFGLQAVILGMLVLVPLIYTDALPLGNLKSWVEIPLPPGPRSAPPPTGPRQPRPQHSTNMEGTIVLAPPRIPDRIAEHLDESAAPMPSGPYVPGAPGGSGSHNPVFDSILASNMHAAAPPPPPSIQKPVRLSTGVTEGLLIQKIMPPYPPIARQIRAQGAVVLQATIGRDGTIRNLQAISGHPTLIQAAVDAVKQWRYRPYFLNGEPVEVETQITVNFTLN
jgi:protein TonB